MEVKWMKRKIEPSDFEELENKHRQIVNLGSEFNFERKSLPFGDSYLQWVIAKERILNLSEFELWHFKSPECSWYQLAGREGYAVFCKSPNKTSYLSTGWFTYITRMS